MRKWNKLLALLLAMVMVFGLTATAFAEENGEEAETPAETSETAEGEETAEPAEGEEAAEPTEGEEAAEPTEGEESAEPADETDYTGVESWALEAVKNVVVERKLVALRETGLEPAATMTRAEFVAALYNLAGTPAVEGENEFTDVADDASYKDAVIWANANGIVKGNGDGTFNPGGELEREQIFVFLYRYAKEVAKNDVAVEGDSLADFADVADVHDWAVEGLNWAVAKGLVQGSDGKLNPQDPAQRQMAITFLSRYITNIMEAEATEPTEGEEAAEPTEGEDENAAEPTEGEGEDAAEPTEGEGEDAAEPAEGEGENAAEPAEGEDAAE